MDFIQLKPIVVAFLTGGVGSALINQWFAWKTKKIDAEVSLSKEWRDDYKELKTDHRALRKEFYRLQNAYNRLKWEYQKLKENQNSITD